MPTPCGCPPEIVQTPCAPKPCVQENCACPVLIKSDCVNNINVDTPCVNIPKGLPFNEWMPLAFTKLCDKFASIQGYFTLQNVGTGVGKLFAGIALTGERKIKSILGSNLITITDQTEEVKVEVNQTALTTLITSLIPTTNSSWKTQGNANTNLTLDFLGTTDFQNLIFKTNAVPRGFLSKNGGFFSGNESDINSFLAQNTLSFTGFSTINQHHSILNYGDSGFSYNYNNITFGGNPLNPTIPLSGSSIGKFHGINYDGTGNFRTVASMLFTNVGQPTASSMPSKITFSTTPLNSVTRLERLVINENGNVGIGTATPTAKLDVAGQVKIVDGTQGVGKVLTSDATGLATWNNLASPTQVINGVTTNVTGNGTALTPFVIETTNLQKEIKNDYTLSNSDNNYVIFVDNTSTNITITIPAGLISNFQCGFIQEATFETTFVAGVGVTLNNPIGFRIKGQKYNVFLEKKQATETYYLLGNTKV